MKVRFSATQARYVKRWVLAFGADAEVLEPEGLRQEIAAELKTLVSAYSGA